MPNVNLIHESVEIDPTPMDPTGGLSPAPDPMPTLETHGHNFTKIMIMVANYYGIGRDFSEAKANLRKQRGSALKQNEPQIWYVIAEDTAVNQVDGGLIYSRSGSHPLVIHQRTEDDS